MSFVVVYRAKSGNQLFGCATLAQVAELRRALGFAVTSSRVATLLERADWRMCKGGAA